jgi:hypothetical protein
MDYELLNRLRLEQVALSNADFITWCNTQRQAVEFVPRKDLMRALIGLGLYAKIAGAQASANQMQAAVAVSAIAGLQTYDSVYLTDPLLQTLLAQIVAVGILTQAEVDAAIAAIFYAKPFDGCDEAALAGLARWRALNTLETNAREVAEAMRAAVANLRNNTADVPTLDQLFAAAKG